MSQPARILIVDDEIVAIQMLRKALHSMGKLFYAREGQEALDRVRQAPPDLVLLDANMPGLDGFAICRQLHQEYPDLPIIFVTAASDNASEVRALEAGALDSINKPFNPPVVRARVNVHLKLKAHNDVLRTLGSRDSLTGLWNRRALDERLALEWRRAQRHHQTLALLMIDIDHFKAYNDHYGHIQGDDCLRQVAKAIAGLVNRAGDLVARYGGEEFVVLLAATGQDEALTLAERIRATVEGLAIPHAASSAGPVVSLSIGVAGCLPQRVAGEEPSAPAPADNSEQVSGFHLAKKLVGRADQALYAAKLGGRNRVCVG